MYVRNEWFQFDKGLVRIIHRDFSQPDFFFKREFHVNPSGGIYVDIQGFYIVFTVLQQLAHASSILDSWTRKK